MTDGPFLGGSQAPAGISVSFVRGPFDEVAAGWEAFHRDIGRTTGVTEITLDDAGAALTPLEAPWTTEVVFDCGGWTASLNNAIGGGDPTAFAPAVARRLGLDLVVAAHHPPGPAGHGATQLWLMGPAGVPPLGYVRTIDAVATDGRWSFHTSGAVLPFEDGARYTARRIRDRFDRPLLVTYLAALGIAVDDPAFYGGGRRYRHRSTGPRRTQSAHEALVELGLRET